MKFKIGLKKSVHLSLSVGFVRSHWVQLNRGIIWSKHFKATKHHLHEAYFSQNNLLRSPRYFFIFLTLEECKHMIHHIILTYDLVRWLGVAQIWRPHDSDGSALFGKVWKKWGMLYSGYTLSELRLDVAGQTVTEVWIRETVSWWQIKEQIFYYYCWIENCHIL